MVDLYLKDFDRIVNITYNICNDKYVYNTTGYGKLLTRTLRKIINKLDRHRSITKEDISQQLTLFWIEYQTDFNNKKPNVSRRRYIIWRSIYGLKDWLIKELRIYEEPIEDIPRTLEEPRQRIDVQFLVNGSKEYPFSLLSPYERYLLFLRFYKEMNITEMAALMNKSTPTVRKYLIEVIEILRRKECKFQNTHKKTM